MSGMVMMGLDEATAKMYALYGENRKITDGNYDRSLGVKCINGTFVGKKNGNIIAYKGIPFVGKQPVGNLRWKAPVDVTPDDGVYEAYYFGKVPCQVGSIGQMGASVLWARIVCISIFGRLTRRGRRRNRLWCGYSYNGRNGTKRTRNCACRW